jgi:hypothetical protein
MPLTEKGAKIEKAMEGEYGPKKGEEVFYASKAAGKISGVDTAQAVKDSLPETVTPDETATRNREYWP